MSFYSDLAATVTRLLTKYGQSVTLRRYSVGGGSYDPATGVTSVTTSDEIRIGVILDAPGNRLERIYGQKAQGNTLIQELERWLYIEPNGSVPRLQDHVVVQGTEYVIVDVQTIGPGGIPVAYLLVLRT